MTPSDREESGGLASRLEKVLQLRNAARLVWDSAPTWTAINLGIIVLQGILPLASLWTMKHIVDGVAAGVSTAVGLDAFRPVLGWILLAGGVAVLSALASSLTDLGSQAQSMTVTDAISDLLHAQSIAVDLAYYENPEYYDTLHRAQREASYRPTRIVDGLVQIARSAVSLVGMAGLLFSLNWPLATLLFVVALPGAFVRTLFSRRLYRLDREQTGAERRAWYYHWMMTAPHYAKEIRLFDLGSLFRERFRDLRQRIREARLALTRQRVLFGLAVQVATAVAVYGTFAIIARQTLRGAVSLGGLVVYYQGFQSALGYLRSILTSLAGLYEDSLFISNFYQFLSLTPEITRPPQPRPVPEEPAQGITFEDVCFSYPGATEFVLHDVDLCLSPGEVIALVGENGAGKTTLIKLLCRLYDPAAGRISVDGVDLRDLDPVAWRREISVIFQDYARYQLSVAENIWLGDVAQEPDRERIEEMAHLAGADAVAKRLPRGYDTVLGSWFDDGRELSTGEWQKIALARSFMRDARIVVLDEPTSSLDPLAEAELFHRFRELIQGRSAILISHRFSTVHMADRIYVLEHGTVAEHGTHEELMHHNGLYARMYRAQAQHYVGYKPEELVTDFLSSNDQVGVDHGP